MSAEKPREIAVRILQRRRGSQEYVEKLLEQELARAALSPADRGLCQELVYGIVRWQRTLDWLIHRKTSGREQDFTLQILLQLGLYQLFWLERVPHHAAVHETVELAKRLNLGPKAGFINAVLRGYAREAEATTRDLQTLKEKNPGLGYSHPDWLVERWQKRWGPDKAAQLLAWNNVPPRNFARVNHLKTDTAGLMEIWKKEGVEFVERSWDWAGSDLVFELQSHPSLAGLKSFQQGFFYVQDPSTLLAVRQLNPQPGETILDLCAAPGGKTTYIAQLMQNRGTIVARDNQSSRLKLIAENCERLGVTCVQAAMPPGIRFDRVLVDAPCSNSGVLRRRVELRWRIQAEEIERLHRAQLTLLHDAAALLKPGGTLIYSTCSLEEEENAQVTRAFLKEHPKFTLAGERQLLPFVDGVDGAYAATLRGQ